MCAVMFNICLSYPIHTFSRVLLSAEDYVWGISWMNWQSHRDSGSSSLGRGQKSWAERDWGPEPRSRGPGQRPMQLLVAAWPSEVTETATTVQCHQNKAFSHTQRYGNSYFFSVLLQLLSGGVISCDMSWVAVKLWDAIPCVIVIGLWHRRNSDISLLRRPADY